MQFEDYCVEWYKHHPFAKEIDDRNGRKSDISTLIIQKLDWLTYCKEHNVSFDRDFCDALFEDLLHLLSIIIQNHDAIPFDSFIDYFALLTREESEKYDLKLLAFINDLLNCEKSFDDFLYIYLSWTNNRMEFLANAHLGFPSVEAGWISAHYTRHRLRFVQIRNTDFITMHKLGEYFLKMYEYCKTMDRRAMAGDIVKVNRFVESYMRDLLSSATMNGYYEYEERIKTIIENLKAETDQTPSVFISYSWDDENLVEQIELGICGSAIIHRDKHDIDAGDNITEFMKSIRQQDFVILVVSDKYLESRNCMFEILQLLKDYDENEEVFWDKVVIFVTATGLYTSEGRAQKIKYWIDLCEETERLISRIPAPASEGLVKEAKVLRYISMEIDKLLERAKDTLCHRELEKFIKHLNSRLEKWGKYGENPFADALLAFMQNSINSGE